MLNLLFIGDYVVTNFFVGSDTILGNIYHSFSVFVTLPLYVLYVVLTAVCMR